MSAVSGFGAVGDGVVDDTDALQHAIDAGDGVLQLERSAYRLTRPLVVDLARCRQLAIRGQGGVARLVMTGPGPALWLQGAHTGTADPQSFRPDVWEHERMPTVSELEITGTHPEADGIRIEGVMQPTLTGLLIRRVRHAVHITKRARNVLISHCHLYHNTGVGVFLERVSLHQTIITGSHISFCRLGGIRIADSEIRNLQITGNDIEYNNNRCHGVPGADAEPTAEIYIEAGPTGSVREGTIASNTIQATYSPHGANIRFVGNPQVGNHRVGMWTITGNLIGSQQTNIHLTAARDVTIAGNHLYSGHHRNLLVEGSRNIVVGANCIGHNPDYGKQELATGIRFEDCDSCVLSGLLIEDAVAGTHTVRDAPPLVRDALIELVRCQRMTLSGLQVFDGAPYGIAVQDCSDTVITGATVLDRRPEKQMKAAIQWTGGGTGNLIAASRIGSGTEAAVVAPPHVRLVENVLD